MVVHKPPHIPSRLKPVLYADGLKYRDQLDTIFWVIATEGRDHPLNDRLGEVKVPTLIIWGRHDKLLDVSCVPVLEAGIAGSVSHIFEHVRSEEHTSELQSLMRISYAVFCLKNNKTPRTNHQQPYRYKIKKPQTQ